MAEAAGQLEEACALYEDAALRNSSFALPVARLAMIALGNQQLEKAVSLLEQSLQHDAELWLTNLLIGRGYVELKHFRQARIHLMRALDTTPERGPVLAQLAKAEIGLGNVDAARARWPSSRPLSEPPRRRGRRVRIRTIKRSELGVLGVLAVNLIRPVPTRARKMAAPSF